MATTGAPANLPLLGDDDQITPIQAPINAISKALNDYLKAQDSGWINLTMGSGYTGDTAQIRKIGNIVQCRGQINKASGNFTGTETGIATIPVGFRPAATSLAVPGIGGGVVMAKLIARAAGTIEIAGTPTGNTPYFRIDNLSWMTG